MSVTITLPNQAERTFRETWGEQLNQKAFDALVIQGYREKLFSIGRVAELVGLSTTIQAEEWLADRRVERNCDPADFRDDYSAIITPRTTLPR